MSIPKIIHYCWFGGNPLSPLAQKCIASWKKFLPDYEIKEWNESNYDVSKIPYTAQAYDMKKYAFVSDYARFDILYQYGGVYFDTDVEVIKDLHPIIERGAFIGVEKRQLPLLNAGLGIASPAASIIYREILDSYQKAHFINEDGSLNLETVVTRVSEIFMRHGFVPEDRMQIVADTTIYPSEYFCPKSTVTGVLELTQNSYTVHHFAASWVPKAKQRIADFQRKMARAYGANYFSLFLTVCAAPVLRAREDGLGSCIAHYVYRYIYRRGIRE